MEREFKQTMNNLSNKYNIPAETLKKMLKDGVISCSWARWEEIYDCYKKQLSISGSRGEAVNITSVDKNVSVKHVYEIIHHIEG
jgi:hypothetical protein